MGKELMHVYQGPYDASEHVHTAGSTAVNVVARAVRPDSLDGNEAVKALEKIINAESTGRKEALQATFTGVNALLETVLTNLTSIMNAQTARIAAVESDRTAQRRLDNEAKGLEIAKLNAETDKLQAENEAKRLELALRDVGMKVASFGDDDDLDADVGDQDNNGRKKRGART
jgi:hypothetical protein